MSAKDTQIEPRVLGHRTGLDTDPADVVLWVPPTPEEAATRAPLSAPPARPVRPVAITESAPPAEGESAQATPAVERPRSVPAGAPARPERPASIREGTVQARVWERPEDTAKLIRTIMLQSDDATPEDLPPMQRIAILFIALGQQTSGEVMKHLSDYEVEETTRAVATLRTVSAEMQAEVLADIEKHLIAGQWIGQGGLGFAQGALERAVGPRKAKEILDRVASTVTAGFSMLRNATPAQLVPFLSYEHPQTIALILSQLQPVQSAGILAQLSHAQQVDVSHRIATLREVKPEILKAVEESMEAQLRDIIGGTHSVGGPKVLADILNLSSEATEVTVLDGMDTTDAETSESVKKQMFTYADIESLSDIDLELLLKECDPDDLVVALKKTSESLKARIHRCVGDDRWQALAAAMEKRGPMRTHEVEEVQLQLVTLVRQLEEQGRVTVVRGPDPNPLV